jgi:hypothetical protein
MISVTYVARLAATRGTFLAEILGDEIPRGCDRD